MKYLKQFGIILTISLIGEILNYLIPLPVPASIYGLVILFTLLMTKVIKLEAVDSITGFLIEIMPIMFVPAAVGLLESIDILKKSYIEFIIIIIVSTIVVMVVSGLLVELILKLHNKKEDKDNAGILH